MTTANPRSPQPHDLPEVAHEPGPDSRGLKFRLPGNLAWPEMKRVREPAGDSGSETPPPSARIHIAGMYFAAPDCAHKAPCHVCRTPRPVVLTAARPLLGVPYAICPPEENLACLDRAAKERAAVTELIAAPAEPEKAADAPAKVGAEPAAKAPARPRKPRVRPSAAKEAALSEGTAKTAEAAAEDGVELPGDDAA